MLPDSSSEIDMMSISEGRVEADEELRGRGREQSTSVMSVTSLMPGNPWLPLPDRTNRSERGTSLDVVLSLDSLSNSLTSVDTS